VGDIEAVLTYRPVGIGAEHSIPVGATTDPAVLRVLRDQLIAAAAAEAARWRTIDPGVAAMKTAEAERLIRVLAFLLPDDELRPALRLMPKPNRDPVDDGNPPEGA
jgi:hypothetical protein